MSVSHRFMCIISVICLICIILTAAICYHSTHNSLDSRTTENTTLFTKAAANDINNWMENKILFLESAVNVIELNGDKDTKKLKSTLEFLYNSDANTGDIYDIYFTSTDNVMTSASDYVPDKSLDFVHNSEWYTTASKTHELYISSAYQDVATKNTTITIAHEVIHNDNLIGVIGIDIFTDKLDTKIDELNDKLSSDDYIFLLDNNNGLLVHPNKDYGFVNYRPVLLNTLPDNPYDKLIEYIKTKDTSSEPMWIKDYDNVKRSLFTVDVPCCGWNLCTAISNSTWHKSQRNMLTSLIFSLAATCILLILICDFIFLKPLIKMLNNANDSSQSKSEFVSTIATRIQPSLNSIIGMNEIIMHEATSESIKKCSENIKTAGFHLVSLINDVADISHLETGVILLENKPYSLSSMLFDLITSTNQRAREKGLSAEYDISPKLPSKLIGDEVRIRQIITKLLSNAIRYTDKGLVKLTVQFKQLSTDTIQLTITVEDTGVGISSKHLENIFNSLVRLQKDDNDIADSNGLGLKIVKQLVDEMSGSVEADSEYGSGSIFTVRIPQKVSDAKPIGMALSVVDSLYNDTQKEEDILKTTNAKILVVDSNDINLQIYQVLLKHTSLTVDTANSLEECLNKLKLDEYSIIFLDSKLPNKQASQALQSIRVINCNNCDSIPVVLVAVNSDSLVNTYYAKAGFSDFLSKPISGIELEKIIRNYIKK